VTMTNAVCPEKWKYTYGGITCAGILNSWFLKTLAPYTKKEDYVCPTDFSVLEQEAKKVPPGSHGLLVLPYFMGERSPVWDSEARGIFCGLSVNHSRGHMYRAILESLAYAVRHIRETSRIFENASDICIASGGACSCSLWMQILADVLGITIITVSEQAQAPVGDCIIAGVSSGIIPSFDWAEKWCIYEKRYEPNKKNTNFYEPFYEEYKNLYESTSSILHRLSNLSHKTASKS
ncbi:MAG: FGGY-family carbohydrate kinase, partial [Lachnoclostridium edouardi]|uniref:xylulokinase n=1 Tax=Lachnoclostridium edouardi TaxID=1926283 RepID=UPI0026DC3E90